MLSFLLPGWFLLRYEARRFVELLFHEPPRRLDRTPLSMIHHLSWHLTKPGGFPPLPSRLVAGLLQTSLPTRPVPPARTTGLARRAGRAAFVLDPGAPPPQGLGCGCHHHGMSRPAFTVGDGSRRRAVHLDAIRATSSNLSRRGKKSGSGKLSLRAAQRGIGPVQTPSHETSNARPVIGQCVAGPQHVVKPGCE